MREPTQEGCKDRYAVKSMASSWSESHRAIPILKLLRMWPNTKS